MKNRKTNKVIFWFLLAVAPLYGRYDTSTSDTDEYIRFCIEAVESEEVFSRFKIAPVYNVVLEHVSEELGRGYLDVVLEQTPELLEKIEAFRENDRIGSPVIAQYAETGALSPTTVRYMKVASDLKTLFGDELEGARVIEIGGGYGGLCKILSEYFHFQSYTIVDLPEPLLLAKKYLERMGICGISFLTHLDPIPEGEFDLVIANYSFCECTGAMQDKYAKEILSCARRGYITCNPPNLAITPSKDEMLEKLRRHFIPFREIPERPNLCAPNYILFWD